MTVTEAATRLLYYLSPDEREIPDSTTYPGRNAWALAAINGAMQEIWGLGPEWIRAVDWSFRLAAPSTITLTLTENSKTATIANGSWSSAYLGQALMFSGTGAPNRVMAASAGASTTTLTLLSEWTGTTGSHEADMFFDTAALPSGYLGFLSVRVAGGDPLTPVPTPIHGDGLVTDEDYSPLSVSFPASPQVGEPDRWHAGRWGNEASTDTRPGARIRVWPLPDEEVILETRMSLGPQVFSTIDNTQILVPLDFVDTVLMPVASQRFQACPFFRSEEQKREIARQYEAAMRIIGKHAPQRPRSIQFVSLY